MTALLRVLSVIVGAAGVIGGLLLIVQAQRSDGQVTLILAGSGAAAALSGLFWSVLGTAVASVLRRLEEQKEEATEPSQGAWDSSEERPEREGREVDGGDVIQAIVLTVVVVLLVVVAITTSA